MQFQQTSKSKNSLIKKCHICGVIIESTKESMKCPCCNKSFLPLNYFGKIHGISSSDFENLFAESHELCESDLIKGLYVIW